MVEGLFSSVLASIDVDLDFPLDRLVIEQADCIGLCRRMGLSLLAASCCHQTLSSDRDLFVADGINSVGDYNLSRVGVVCLFVCVCPHFFSRFTMG